MEYQEIELKGKFFAEKVATKPAWGSSDEGRMIYALDTHKFHIGNTTDWEELSYGDASTFLLNNTNQSIEGNFLPGTDNTHSLGSGVAKWLEVTGTTFTGVVTTATYADLAEKYTTREKFSIGTILEVAYEEEFDLTETSGLTDCFVGVVSEKPGFVMNQDAEGQLVGLVGRVPIRIIGPVNKRDIIVATNNGCGKADNHEELIYKVAVALETNSSPYEKLVDCIIK
jgi:hypothetical protein